MNYSDKEITLFFNPAKMADRATLAYSKTMEYKIQDIDVSQQPMSPTILTMIAEKLNLSPKELVDKDSDIYRSKYKDSEFDDNQSMTMITQNHEFLKTPIAVSKDFAMYIKNPKDLLYMDKRKDSSNYKENVSD